jgi:arabinofuranosyltransferase
VTALAAILFLLFRRSREGWAMAAGVILYLVYVVRIGGDFMSGRFLAAPFLLSVLALLISTVPSRVRRRRLALLACVGLLAMVSRSVVLPSTRITFLRDHFSGTDPKWNRRAARRNFRFISDQRGDASTTGLIPVLFSPTREVRHSWVDLGRGMASGPARVFVWGAVGLVGYYGGPRVHVVDPPALGDPLLARLPATLPWFVGHYDRRLPPGYLETLETGRNVIEDPNVRAYYEDLRLVTRGPIWSVARFRAIARLNLGRDEALLRDYGATIADAQQAGGAWRFEADDGQELWERGLRLRLAPACNARRLEVVASGPAIYTVRYYESGHLLGTQALEVSDNNWQPVYAKVILAGGTRFDRVDLTLNRGIHPAILRLVRLVP